MLLKEFTFPATFAVLSLACLDSSVRGNPSHRDMEAPLNIHNVANSQELLTKAKGLYEQSSKSLQGVVDGRGRASTKVLSQIHISLRQLRRTALDLQMHGEPAGFDFELRAGRLDEPLMKAVGQLKSSQAGVGQINKIRQYLSTPRTRQARDRVCAEVKQLMQKQQVLLAYDKLHQTLDEWKSMTIFLEDREPANDLGQLDDLEFMLRSRQKLFRQQIREALTTAGNTRQPDMKVLADGIVASADALRTSATVAVDGQTLSGPEYVEHAANAWRKVHLAALHCRAIDWARRVSIPSMPHMTEVREPYWIDEGQYSRFVDETVKGLAAIIEADAERAQGPEAAKLYSQYVEVLAPLAAQLEGDKLTSAIEAALEKLASKSPDFHKEVEAYRESTDELLRWRERVAASVAEARAAEFPSSDELLLKSLGSRQGVRGLLDEKQPNLRLARLIGSVPEIMPVATQETLDKQVLVRNVVGLPGGKIGIARYDARHYSTVAAYRATDEIQRLKQDLLITEQLPPLTLRAAIAVDSAERGDFVAVGGVVRGIHLEGLIPRFATLPEGGLSMLALGPLPVEPKQEALLNHVLVRLDVAPSWINHRFFFADVVESNAPGAK